MLSFHFCVEVPDLLLGHHAQLQFEFSIFQQFILASSIVLIALVIRCLFFHFLGGFNPFPGGLIPPAF